MSIHRGPQLVELLSYTPFSPPSPLWAPAVSQTHNVDHLSVAWASWLGEPCVSGMYVRYVQQAHANNNRQMGRQSGLVWSFATYMDSQAGESV